MHADFTLWNVDPLPETRIHEDREFLVNRLPTTGVPLLASSTITHTPS